MDHWLVIDLGGSIVAPSDLGPDTGFVDALFHFFAERLERDPSLSLAFVIGGGAPARLYQKGLRSLESSKELADEQLDELGIAATHLNAEFLRQSFRKYCPHPVIKDYSELPELAELGRVAVGGGWKPGFSTDYDSVLLAEHCSCKKLLCLSNIKQVYSADPKLDPSAVPLDRLTWSDYAKMSGDRWQPGASLPFDPVATAYAAKIGLELAFLDGRDLNNLADYLDGQSFVGTVIS